MNIIFAGTPEIAVPTLNALAGEFNIVAVLTNPDRPAGRGRRLITSPVKEKAQDLGLNILQPQKLDASCRDAVAALNPDLLVVVAFGRIFGPKFLGLFSKGGINLHPSLLPKYRGPSPISAAIMNRDDMTGITVQQISLEMDAGDILLQQNVPLTGTETTESLTGFASEAGAGMMLEVVRDIKKGLTKPRKQNHDLATYCSLLSKDDGIIDWADSAPKIDALIRACTPWPRAKTAFNGTPLTIHEAVVSSTADKQVGPGKVLGVDKNNGILIQTGNGVLAVKKLQLHAKKPLDWKSFLNGVKHFEGAVLGGR